MSQRLLKLDEDDMKALAEDLVERWQNYKPELMQAELETIVWMAFRLGWLHGAGFANNEMQADINYYEEKIKKLEKQTPPVTSDSSQK
jgi:hypothetical protein